MAIKSKKIIFGITTTRADYGILKSLFKSLDKDTKLEFYLVVSGTHFNKKFGYTFNQIKNDNYQNMILIKSKFNSDLPNDLSKDLGRIHKEITKKYNEFSPDLIIVLGDRFELLPFVNIANLFGIKIAHIHGGEVTDGSMDNATRNAISHLSNYHLVSNKKSENLLLKHGQLKKNIINTGSLAINEILKNQFLDEDYLSKKLKIKFGKRNILVLYHPNTLNRNSNNEVDIFFKSLSFFKNINFFFLSPNTDPGSDYIFYKIHEFKKKFKDTFFIPSLSPNEYYSLINYVDCIIGNSSSGIIEVPSLNTYTINVGDRQKGRLLSSSIINTPIDYKMIINSIKSLYKKNSSIKSKNPYFKKDSLKLSLSFLLNKLQS